MDDYTLGYVAGFVDAEASFSVSLKLQRDLRYHVRPDPVFSITQSNEEVLNFLRSVIECGRVIEKPGQRHLKILIIDNLDELKDKLIPFLDKLNLKVKQEQYRIFREIVLKLANNRRKLTREMLEEIIFLSFELSKLNPKSMRRRSLGEILEILNSGDEAARPPGRKVAKCLVG